MWVWKLAADVGMTVVVEGGGVGTRRAQHGGTRRRGYLQEAYYSSSSVTYLQGFLKRLCYREVPTPAKCEIPRVK